MGKHRKPGAGRPPSTTVSGPRALAGVVLTLAAALLLSLTPQLAYRWLLRDGYSRIQVEFVSRTKRGMRVRMVPPGEIRELRGSGFGISGNGTAPAWRNPDAELWIGGIRIFDETVVLSGAGPEVQPVGELAGLLLLNAVCGMGAYRLLRPPIARGRA